VESEKGKGSRKEFFGTGSTGLFSEVGGQNKSFNAEITEMTPAFSA
jgi:hypothetical protein